jgi:hypothetical protein
MKIVTVVVNNPDFIAMQHALLKKYITGDEYEFIVFNDAKDFPDFSNFNDISLKQQIRDMCTLLKIQCIDIPNQHHRVQKEPSHRNADSMNFILEYQKQHPDKYLALDSDMFLVDNLDLRKYAEYSCGLLLHSKGTINYFWHGINYMDFTQLTDTELLNWNLCPTCDTGGMLHVWLDKKIAMCDETMYFIPYLRSTTWNLKQLPDSLKSNKKLVDFLINDVRNENGNFFCEIYDDVFLHYRAGSNWRREGRDVHTKLTADLKNALGL